VNTAILDRYDPAALQELLPNGGWSKADCDEHAFDARIQDRQPSRGIHLDDDPQFYGEFQPVVLARVSYGNHCYSTPFNL
jgi:hypothetical protein